MKETLIRHHQQMDATENQRLMGAHARYQQLFQFRKHAYEDRLNGLVLPSEWKTTDDALKTEQEQLKREIDAVENGADDRINQGITLIELLERTESIWESASKSKKVKILKTFVSNLVLTDGSIGIVYRKPFDLLAESGEKEKWLGRKDWLGHPDLTPRLPARASATLQRGLTLPCGGLRTLSS